MEVMSEGEFHAYVGLLTVSAVILSVLAARGFGQSAGARVLDGLFAAGFLGYAGYLVLADPDTVRIFFYAFAVPVVGIVQAVRATRAARSRQVSHPAPYGAEPAPVPPQPFPSPPTAQAADPATDGAHLGHVPSPDSYRAMSAGRPADVPVTGPEAATPPAPSPDALLHHAEPAATAEYTYAPRHHEPRHAEREPSGRHRMPEPDDAPPADWPPHRA
jgi:hypothetical protein